MKTLSKTDSLNISAGCGESTCPFQNSCKNTAILMLNTCSMDELSQINLLFKDTIQNEPLVNADSNARKAALINALENADFI
jgi:hypothetical protein